MLKKIEILIFGGKNFDFFKNFLKNLKIFNIPTLPKIGKKIF